MIPLVLQKEECRGPIPDREREDARLLVADLYPTGPGQPTGPSRDHPPESGVGLQIYAAAKQLNRFAPTPLTIHNYVGGTDKAHQIEQLERKQPQLVIGTPGRILDLINSQALDIHLATQFVIDEADMTLDMGFLEPVDQIAAHFPSDLQMMVFSATIPQGLRPF